MSMNRRVFLARSGLVAGGVISGAGALGAPQKKAQPNMLVVLADDCTFRDLPLYGGENAKTPHIDKLASEGVVFNRAYLGMSMCQPCRSELYSGLYPLRNGCTWNHAASRNGLKTMPQRLGALGYRVGLTGKVHVKPASTFPFKMVNGFERSCTRNPTMPHNLAGIREFMSGDGDEPFCLVIALVESHVPWVMGDPSAYPPKKIKLPENIADTPQMRQDFSKYLAEITYMDSQVGDILKTLGEVGKVDDTLVLFSSEQGGQFPGCKWTAWDTGLHTAMVARWPGRIAAGERTDAMVQYADVLPTFVEMAGGDAAQGGFDGESFLSVLRGKAKAHRKYAYGMHNNFPEGPPYPIRTITDGRYRYIHNLLPDEMYIEKHLMGVQGNGSLNNPYWATWVGSAWANDKTYGLVKRYTHRPAEELYDLEKDPYELKNLIADSGLAPVKRRLSMELRRWMKEQGDPGAPLDTQQAHEAARKGEHIY